MNEPSRRYGLRPVRSAGGFCLYTQAFLADALGARLPSGGAR